VGRRRRPGQLHRAGVRRDVRDLVDVAQFLASEAASFMVGETVTVKGTPDILEQP
jgi:NAD(P)-dependent dehydrogenase (short-subunit alcohol dehydrogenase family)